MNTFTTLLNAVQFLDFEEAEWLVCWVLAGYKWHQKSIFVTTKYSLKLIKIIYGLVNCEKKNAWHSHPQHSQCRLDISLATTCVLALREPGT